MKSDIALHYNILIHCFVAYTVTGTVERIIAVLKTYNEF